MEDLIITSIGLGLLVSLVFSEVLGIAAGGMVVPGYFALYLDQPSMIITTLLVAYVTYAIVHSLSSFMIIYGRRRTAQLSQLFTWFADDFGGTPANILNFVADFATPDLAQSLRQNPERWTLTSLDYDWSLNDRQ